MIKIQESEMSFGEFQEENLFHIEKSKIYKNLGDGIKTVEFILRYDEKSIVFLEAKKSCPNVAKRYENEKKSEKFEEYYRNLLGGLYRENPVKSRNYEAVKSSKKWENVGNSYIIPALLLYRYSYI